VNLLIDSQKDITCKTVQKRLQLRFYTRFWFSCYNLSSNKNASLLELFYQIQTHTELVQSNFPFNNILAHEHSKDAISELFSKNWTKVIADRNIVVNILLPSLNTLNQLTESRNSSYSEIKGEVSVLNSILYRFISLYYGDNNEQFYNPSFNPH
jgi:hypothetical protein